MTSIELFAGCGGLALGLEVAGIVHKRLIENNEDCVNTMKANKHKWNVELLDVKNAKYTLNEVEIVTGGFPCQSFSQVGKKEGLDDPRGMLFYEYLRCVHEVKPILFLIENVEGLYTFNGGETIKYMIKLLEDEGYSIKYELINMVEYRVPQKRKRVIIVGMLGKENYFEFPEKADDLVTLREALKDVPESDCASYTTERKEIYSRVPQGGCWIDLPLDLQKKLLGNAYNSGGGKRGYAKRLSWDEPCLTILTSPCQKQTERIHPDEVRPLSVRECARVQTFPDKWKFTGSMQSQYKQIGNAVPPRFALALGKQIIKAINKYKKKDNIYLDFISNEGFEKLVNDVTAYYKCDKQFDEPIYDRTKMSFETALFGLTYEKFKENERLKAIERGICTKIGFFHQKLLGSVEGWENLDDNLEIKKVCQADLRKKDNTIFIELKNRANTVNSASKKECFNRLKTIRELYPDALVYYGIIEDKVEYDKVWNYNGNNDEKLRTISGEKLYQLVTGNPENFLKVMNAIQSAIKNIQDK